MITSVGGSPIRPLLFLQVDRDVCRRAFYKEPLGLVSKVVYSVRSWEDDPVYDPEKLIESWARDVDAGVYDEDRRYGGDLVPIGDIARDEFLHPSSRPRTPQARRRVRIPSVPSLCAARRRRARQPTHGLRTRPVHPQLLRAELP